VNYNYCNSRAGQIDLGTPVRADLLIYRGDSASLLVSIVDDDGNPVDVTSATWRSQIRNKSDDLVVLCDLEVAPAQSGLAHEIEVFFTAENTAKLISTTCVWDLEMTLAEWVTTLMAGQVKVTKDVSRPPVQPLTRR
jgi:hypothetical protein